MKYPHRRSRNRFQTIPNIPPQRDQEQRDRLSTAHSSESSATPPNSFTIPELEGVSREPQLEPNPDPPLPFAEGQLRETEWDVLRAQESIETELLNALSSDQFGHDPEHQNPQNSDDQETPVSDEDDLVQLNLDAADQSSSLTNVCSVSPLAISSWRVIWGLLVTGGSMKMTKIMYHAMRSIVDTFSKLGYSSWNITEANLSPDTSRTTPFECLPHFSTLNRVFRPLVLNSLAPRPVEHFELMDDTKPGARPSKYSAEGLPLAKLRLILPSEYARADIETGPVFRELRSTSLDAHFPETDKSDRACAISSKECVDLWPIVSAREIFYGPSQTVSLDFCQNSSFHTRVAERVDCIKVQVLGSDPLCSELLSSFMIDDDVYPKDTVLGVVVAVWTVLHFSRRQVPGFDSYPHDDLSARDRAIYDTLNFVSYTSPTDSVGNGIQSFPIGNNTESDASDHDNERELPEKRRKVSSRSNETRRQRRAAMVRRKSMEDRAWRDWLKPLLKPGDVIALLRPRSPPTPTLTEEQSSPTAPNSRICLVHRFWREREERSRHMLWIPSRAVLPNAFPAPPDSISNVCSILNFGGSQRYRDVLRASMHQMHGEVRGAQRFKPVSSFGNGENYVIYRFLLFWDGFQISEGKSASGEGFYLLCLNLPLEARSSPHAVRIVSLAPPGVKPDAVFKLIQSDIIQGMTKGFMDIDAEGKQRRIFLDLVGVVGDIPALNGVLDVLGHTSTFCRHLCTFFRRSTSLVGSRYTRSGFDGTLSHASRRYHQHTAVRDCRPCATTCKLLGMKHLEDESRLPLHLLRQAMAEVKNQIPITCTGQKLLAGDLDPYRASFVAPDHLLSGHIRDCLNLAFKALPTPVHRKCCEAFLIGLLTECRLPTQNRLYDHEKRKLFTMSMSELYALIVVAEHGFKFGYMHADSMVSTPIPNSDYFKSEIVLLQSSSRLVAGFWYLPRSVRDGVKAVESFDANAGYDTVAQLQLLTEDHLQRVEDLCAMADDDVCAMEDARCGKRRRADICKEHKARVQAIKLIDKPNLHRLRELAYTTLPMLGHVSRVGELILERAHQTLKRGIKQSNNKEPHLQALKSHTFNDWQGRLSLLASGALSGDEGAVLGCFRLLSGREAVENLNPHQVLQVREAIGPGSCVPAQLNIQGMSVISNTISDPILLSWKVGGSPERGRDRNSFSTSERRRVYDSFTRAFAFRSQPREVEIGDYIISTSDKVLHPRRFEHGDVLGAVCVRPNEASFHFPFVILADSVHSELLLKVATGLFYWFAISFVTFDHVPGIPVCFAAVLPCRKLPQSTDQTVSTPRYTVLEHSRLPLISFVRVTSSLRYAAAYHACIPPACTVLPHRGTIEHCVNSSPLQGGYFYIKSGKEGYTPRQG